MKGHFLGEERQKRGETPGDKQGRDLITDPEGLVAVASSLSSVNVCWWRTKCFSEQMESVVMETICTEEVLFPAELWTITASVGARR